MGEVYRARDSRLNRTVAIKVLAAHVSADVEFRARFEREARAIAALNHPHICTLHDIGRHDGIDFLVMEHLEGQTLAARVATGVLPLREALAIAIDIASALDDAHRQGIVHRDLKPANVMLTKSGAKLLDFGLATRQLVEPVRSADVLPTASVAMRLTSPHAIVGTLPYMAPEQLEGKDADARTDIYALGAVLYEMLTGQRPFDGKTPASLIAAILTATPPVVTQLRPHLPSSLNHIVATCLARVPDERWQSVRDAAHSLRGITDTSSTVAEVNLYAARTLAGTARVDRRRPWAARGAGHLGTHARAPRRSRRLLPCAPTIPFGPGQRLAVGETPAFAVSPDGSSLAYVVTTSGGGTELYVRRLDSTTATLVANSSGASYPQFSPDSRWIAFIVAEGLRRVPLAGGAPVTVTSAGTFLGVRGLAWSPDKAFIVSTFRTGLMRVADSGGVPTILTSPEYDAREKSHRWPFLLPAAHGALMTVSTADATSFNEARVDLVQLSSGQRTKLIDGGLFARYLPTGHIVFARAGALFAAPFNPSTPKVNGQPVSVLAPLLTEPAYGHAHFDISETGTLVYVGTGERRHNRTLLWVDSRGNRTPAVASRRAFNNGSISPDGRQVAAAVEGATSEIWAYDLGHDKSTRLAYGWDNNNPVWTADSQRILFASTRGRSHTNNIYWQASDAPAGQSSWWAATTKTCCRAPCPRMASLY